MVKRSKLEIIKDILTIIQGNKGTIKKTPLLRKSNLSSARFGEYYKDLIKKHFVVEQILRKEGMFVTLTEKGKKFLMRYQSIVNFIDEFDL